MKTKGASGFPERTLFVSGRGREVQITVPSGRVAFLWTMTMPSTML